MLVDRIATEQCLLLLVPRYDGSYTALRDWELTIVAGDTKAGTLIAKDKFGNKYYENLEEELPCEHGWTRLLELFYWLGDSANKMGGL
jgi:hypothetical protein